MTEEDALKTCTGWIGYPDVKGYFPFQAANFLVGTGKYVFESCCHSGYVLRILSKEDRERAAVEREKNRHGGALDWLNR